MCFDAKSASVASVAKKDIVAYKVFNVNSTGSILSPYKAHIWQIGKTEEEVRFKRIADYKNQGLNYGFHALRTKEDAKTFLRQSSGNRIMEVIIPKGSLYFINQTQIISDKMRIDSDKRVVIPRTKKAAKKK